MGSANKSSSDASAQVPPDIANLRRTLSGGFEQGLEGLRPGPPPIVNDAAKIFAAIFDPTVLERGSASSKKFDPTGPPIQAADVPPSFGSQKAESAENQQNAINLAVEEALIKAGVSGNDSQRKSLGIFGNLFDNQSQSEPPPETLASPPPSSPPRKR